MDPKSFIQRIERKEAVVGVIGLGYVGLPLVMEFCRAGFRVIGFDIDATKTEMLNRGESYIRHISDEDVAKTASSGLLEATTEFARVGEADALLICVPTPLTNDNDPDLSYVESTGHAIAPYVREGHLVILESTTYPGTTREVLQPVLEAGGLKAGADFLLAYSPEREDPGNPTYSTGKIPKVVGGLDANALQVATSLYDQIVVSTVPVSSTDTAEAVKLLENIFRSVNIALVNELKMIYEKMDIDVWEVIDAASTKPFGYMPFYPGPGLGGHCIPIDPFYLSWKAKQYGVPAQFIELAGKINTAMPQYVVDHLEGELRAQGKALEGARVFVLGAAYKKDIGDPRESPGLALMEILIGRDAVVEYNDPYVPKLPKQRVRDLGLESVEITEARLNEADVVLIATAHTVYDYALFAEHAQLIIDTRNAMSDVIDTRGVVRKV